MKISNNQNLSFKAQFVMKVEPKLYPHPSSDKYERCVELAPRKSTNFLKFLGFLQSKEGNEVLNKLPKDDIITLESPFFVNDETGRITIEPFFIYEPSDLTEKQEKKLAFTLPDFRAESTFLDPSRNMVPQFKKWINDIVGAREDVLKDSSIK